MAEGMFDYARMMGLQDLGPAPLEYEQEDYGAALDMRDGGETQHQQPWLHQDYSNVNPYDEGAHGSWLDDSMMGLMDGMGMLTDEQSTADAGLDIPLGEDEGLDGDEMDEETDALLDEEMALDEDSADFQGMGGEDDEGL